MDARRTTDVDLSQVQERLSAVQSQIDQVLSKLAHKAAGMQLETVEVSLAITVEGNVGIASAGTQASLTLSYAVSQPSATGSTVDSTVPQDLDDRLPA